MKKPQGSLAILVLDDDPARHIAFAAQTDGHDVAHVWTVRQAIASLDARRWDVVCLDNDLETEPNYAREGAEVADHIALMPEKDRPRAVIIHSWNNQASRRMEATLGRIYEPGKTLLRWEFGDFRLLPSGTYDGELDLGRWTEGATLAEVLKPVPKRLARYYQFATVSTSINEFGDSLPMEWGD